MKKNPVDEYLRKRKNSNRHRNKLLAVILTLSMAVFFTVNMGLRLTGITMTGDGDTAAAESSNDTAESTAETVNEEVTPDAAENTAAPENSAGGGPSTADPVTTETPAAEDTQQFTLTSAEADGFTVTVSGDPSVLPYPAEEMSVSVKAQDVSDLNETQKNLYDTLLASQAEQAEEIYEASKDEDGTQTEEVDDTTLDAAKQNTEDQSVVTSDGTAVENNNSDTKSSRVTNYLFDVTLKHGDETVEPTGKVQVSIQSALFTNTDSDISVIHLDEVKNEPVDTKAVINTDEGTAVLTTSSFSVFVIEGSNQYTYYSLIDAFTKAPAGATIRLDSDYDEDVLKDITFTIDKNLTLDLYGHYLHFNETGSSAPFTVTNGSSFTIMDSSAEGKNPTYKDTISTDTVSNNYNNTATNSVDDVNKTDTVTYYVTESTVSGTGTTEITKKHVYSTKGYIVGDIKTGYSTGLVYVSSGATFNLQSGLLTAHTNYEDGYDDGHSVFNCGTFNMTGGYIVGRNSNQKGTGVCATSGSTTNLSGGVIAANNATNGGAGIYLDSGTLNIYDGAMISGNKSNYGTEDNKNNVATYGGGGGIYVKGQNGKINIYGGYITNNSYTGTTNEHNTTPYGGGAIYAQDKSVIKMTGGKITGNYSENGGGGLYIGCYGSQAAFYLDGGIIASNYCEYGEGGGIRVAGAGDSKENGSLVQVSGDKPTYITNNQTHTNKSWGGGGIFVQTNGNLNLKNVLITSNKAEGFGGGFASCPTGDTDVNMSFAGIFSNTANGTNFSKEALDNKYDDTTAKNAGITNEEAADYFVGAYSHGNGKVATLTNDMLGGGTSNWKGKVYIHQPNDGDPSYSDVVLKEGESKELEISKMAALHAYPSSDAQTKAITAAKVFITNNTSNTNGGGIMTNGYVTVGEVRSSNKYPVINISGTKVLQLNKINQSISEGKFDFEILKTQPSYENGKLKVDSNSIIKSVSCNASDASNVSAFNFSEVSLGDYITSGSESGTIHLYLVEKQGNDNDVEYSQVYYDIAIPYKREIIQPDSNNSLQTEIFLYQLVNNTTDATQKLIVKKYSDSNTATTIYPSDDSSNVNSYTVTSGNTSNNYQDYKDSGTLNLVGDDYTFINTKYSRTVLPKTGGIGTDWFILGGCGLISIALIYALLIHSRREGGDLG